MDETEGSMLICRNPKGRTGVRGRGSLWRWGPNHSILGVVTRCKTKKEEGKPREHVLQDGKKILEFITIQQPESEKFELPGVSCSAVLMITDKVMYRKLSPSTSHKRLYNAIRLNM